ncbi:hypothetical protein BCR34DRAFT_165888 [Clohesyomyces aquaticus]|uniref:Uncharacterized protein n=1 Tax=Clohesyomyces aquaticus TaxID=1231657 RepID=A0A1Y1YHF0_9PLEO|nr:hypothetical protein BCR34DRAFT_165888 [Clohesyomyces aquaticus]
MELFKMGLDVLQQAFRFVLRSIPRKRRREDHVIEMSHVVNMIRRDAARNVGTNKAPALVQHDAYDPLMIITWGLGTAGAILCLVIGLGAFNSTPNFGFLTYKLKKNHPTSTGAVIVILANIISLFLKAPMLRLLSVSLRYRFGHGKVIKLRELNLYRFMVNENMLSWDGFKAWWAAPWWLMITAVPWTLMCVFMNALIVPLLTQTWAPFEPYGNGGGVYGDVYFFNETLLRDVTVAFAGIDATQMPNRLSYQSTANLSYESSVQYAVNPRRNSGATWAIETWAGPRFMSWIGGLPAVPFPFDEVDGAETVVGLRYLTNLGDSINVATTYTTAGLDIGHQCDVFPPEQRTNSFQLQTVLTNDWLIGCNYTVSGAWYTIQRSRGNSTGWITQKKRFEDPHIEIQSQWLQSHARRIAELIVSKSAFLLEYEDVYSPGGREQIARDVGKVYVNALSALYMAYFSSIFADPSAAPKGGLKVEVLAGLFGQDTVAKTTAALLATIVVLSTACTLQVWVMSKKFISAADLINPISTLGLKLEPLPSSGMQGMAGASRAVKTGSPEVVIRSFQGIRMAVGEDEHGQRQPIIFACKDIALLVDKNDMLRLPEECDRFGSDSIHPAVA